MTSEAPFTLVQFMREGLDPVPELGRLRAEDPISRLEIPGGPTAWLVTRHEDARAVLSDATRFSNDFTRLIGDNPQGGQDPGLGFRDPPEHTRMRRMLTPEFTMRRLRRLVPRIDAIVADHLDAMERSEHPVDLVEAFAKPIPSLVICELLGVPYAERAEFQRYSNDRFDVSGALESIFSAMDQSLSYLEELVARERKEPGDGLLGMLLRTHGDDIADNELAGLADGLLTGGHHTTASMLALGTLVMFRDPEQAALVRDSDEHVPKVVEELLRHLTVVQVAFPRFAREEVVLSGQRIAPGDMVLCSLVAANRDPVLGEGLETVAPQRPVASPHLAFGHGIHRCIGAELARMEMRAAFPALLRRFPTLRLAISEEEIPFRELSIVHGATSLPVTW